MHSGERYFNTEAGLVHRRDNPVTDHSCSSRSQRGGQNKDMGVPCLKVEEESAQVNSCQIVRKLVNIGSCSRRWCYRPSRGASCWGAGAGPAWPAAGGTGLRLILLLSSLSSSSSSSLSLSSSLPSTIFSLSLPLYSSRLMPSPSVCKAWAKNLIYRKSQ